MKLKVFKGGIPIEPTAFLKLEEGIGHVQLLMVDETGIPISQPQIAELLVVEGRVRIELTPHVNPHYVDVDENYKIKIHGEQD